MAAKAFMANVAVVNITNVSIDKIEQIARRVMRDDDAIMNHHVIWEGRSHWTKGSSKLKSPAKKLSILLKMLMVGAHCR